MLSFFCKLLYYVSSSSFHVGVRTSQNLAGKVTYCRDDSMSSLVVWVFIVRDLLPGNNPAQCSSYPQGVALHTIS
jgi:hypothetical protein